MTSTINSRMKSNIEILLGEWGSWKRGENRNVLGYPDQSAFQRMRVDGQRGSDPNIPLVDDDIRKADREINAIHPEYRAVLVAHYVRPGPVKAKLDKLGISRSLYFFRLEFATKQLSFQMGYVPMPKPQAPTVATI